MGLMLGLMLGLILGLMLDLADAFNDGEIVFFAVKVDGFLDGAYVGFAFGGTSECTRVSTARLVYILPFGLGGAIVFGFTDFLSTVFLVGLMLGFLLGLALGLALGLVLGLMLGLLEAFFTGAIDKGSMHGPVTKRLTPFARP